MEPKLGEVRDWAKAKIASGQEPPWAWFQYMKLIETLDAILGAQSCATTMESSQRSESHRDARLQLVDSTYSQGISPLRPATEPPQMPM